MAFYSSHSRNKDSGQLAIFLIAFGIVAWIVSALIGGSLAGILGSLLAIPTAATILLVIREVWVPRQDKL
jgi:hypothetical protein